MVNKLEKYLLNKLRHYDSVELTRAEIFRILEQSSKQVLDEQLQQILLDALIQNEEELSKKVNLNYSQILHALSEHELSKQELHYLLVALLNVDMKG